MLFIRVSTLKGNFLAMHTVLPKENCLIMETSDYRMQVACSIYKYTGQCLCLSVVTSHTTVIFPSQNKAGYKQAKIC